MAAPKSSEEEFIVLVEQYGIAEAARKIGVTLRNANARRRNIERMRGINIKVPSLLSPTKDLDPHPARLRRTVKDGVVLIGSDSHYYPGVISAAHKAFVKFCKRLEPSLVIKNGDELDFPSISRYPSIGWEKRPAVQLEIETTQDRLEEIERASTNADHIWTLGNHDARFETRLATVAPEYAKVNGVHLKDHFPRWTPCWSIWINDDVVVKHRFKAGIHAPHNNTMWAGKTIITGHLHSLKVQPISDYNGTRWGVDCGTMAEPYGVQFVNYTEDNPVSWRSGFIVLTFKDGKLLWPEVAHCYDDKVDFRGRLEPA